MGIIRTRTNSKGDKTYYVRIRLRGHRYNRTFPKLSEAKTWMAKRESDIRLGIPIVDDGPGVPLKELTESFTSVKLPKCKPSVRRNWPYTIKWWVGQLGAGTGIRRIQKGDITRSLDGLRKAGKSASTVVNHKRVASSVFSYAVDQGWIEKNPCEGIKVEKGGKRTRHLDKDTEIPALLDACRASEDRRLYPLVKLALLTGARQNELMTIQWANVDFERGAIILGAKEQKGNVEDPDRLQVPPVVLRELLRPLRQPGAVYVFSSQFQGLHPGGWVKAKDRTGVPTFNAALRRRWMRAVAEAELVDVRFHDLRHTHASLLAANGASIPEIGASLRHADPRSTQRYTHFADDHRRQLVEGLVTSVDSLG